MHEDEHLRHDFMWKQRNVIMLALSLLILYIYLEVYNNDFRIP